MKADALVTCKIRKVLVSLGLMVIMGLHGGLGVAQEGDFNDQISMGDTDEYQKAKQIFWYGILPACGISKMCDLVPKALPYVVPAKFLYLGLRSMDSQCVITATTRGLATHARAYTEYIESFYAFGYVSSSARVPPQIRDLLEGIGSGVCSAKYYSTAGAFVLCTAAVGLCAVGAARVLQDRLSQHPESTLECCPKFAPDADFSELVKTAQENIATNLGHDRDLQVLNKSHLVADFLRNDTEDREFLDYDQLIEFLHGVKMPTNRGEKKIDRLVQEINRIRILSVLAILQSVAKELDVDSLSPECAGSGPEQTFQRHTGEFVKLCGEFYESPDQFSEDRSSLKRKIGMCTHPDKLSHAFGAFEESKKARLLDASQRVNAILYK